MRKASGMNRIPLNESRRIVTPRVTAKVNYHRRNAPIKKGYAAKTYPLLISSRLDKSSLVDNVQLNAQLLKFDRCAGFGKFLLDLFSVLFRDAFFDLGRNGFNQLFGIHQREAGKVLDNLDDV